MGGGSKYTLYKERVKINIGNIIILYFVWSIIQIFFKIIFSEYVNNPYTLNTLLWIPLKAKPPFWYLYVLAVCYILTFFRNFSKINNTIILVFSALLCLAQYWLTQIMNFTVIQIVQYYFFFCIGIYVIHRQEVIACFEKRYIIIVNIIVWSIIGSYTCFFKNELTGWSNIPILGSFMALTISLALIGIVHNHTAEVFEIIGRHSMEVFLMHVFIIAGNRKILLAIRITNFWINVIVNLFMATFIPIFIGIALEKLGLHKMFFKPATYIVEKRRNKTEPDSNICSKND